MQYSQDIVMTHQGSSIFYHILLCLLLTKKKKLHNGIGVHS